MFTKIKKLIKKIKYWWKLKKMKFKDPFIYK